MKRLDIDPDLDFMDLDSTTSNDNSQYYSDEYDEAAIYSDKYTKNSDYYEDGNYSEEYYEDGNYSEEYYEDGNYSEEYYEDDVYYEDGKYSDEYYEDDNYSEEYYEDNSDAYIYDSQYSNSEEVDEDEDEDEKDNKFIKGFNIVLIVFLVVIIGAVIAIICVLNYNSNHKIKIDPNEGTVLDKEPLDMYKRFVPAEIEGYVDDGELNIMILSDDSMTDLDDPDSIPSLIKQSTGANVYTAILPGGVVACKEASYNPDTHPEDAFSLFYQVTQICSGSDGDYGIMEAAFNTYMGDMEDAPKYRAFWDVLHKIPFKKADVIILNYGLNDYLKANEFHGTEIKVGSEIFIKQDGFESALDQSMQQLRQRFPYAQIIAVTPYDILVPDENGELVNACNYNTGVTNIGEYATYVATYAEKNNVTIVDNYLGTDFDTDTVENYVDEDGRTLTKEAKKMLADHIIEFLYFNYNQSHNIGF